VGDLAELSWAFWPSVLPSDSGSLTFRTKRLLICPWDLRSDYWTSPGLLVPRMLDPIPSERSSKYRNELSNADGVLSYTDFSDSTSWYRRSATASTCSGGAVPRCNPYLPPVAPSLPKSTLATSDGSMKNAEESRVIGLWQAHQISLRCPIHLLGCPCGLRLQRLSFTVGLDLQG